MYHRNQRLTMAKTVRVSLPRTNSRVALAGCSSVANGSGSWRASGAVSSSGLNRDSIYPISTRASSTRPWSISHRGDSGSRSPEITPIAPITAPIGEQQPPPVRQVRVAAAKGA